MNAPCARLRTRRPFLAGCAPLGVLLLLYALLALAVLLVSQGRGDSLVDGDEPHYLVMASGIINHGSFEQTQPYREEFASRTIYPHGFAAPGSVPTPLNTHAHQGPHGLYNVHNVGLPLVLALPYLLGGVLGAKLFMILLSCLAPLLVWRIAGALSQERETRFLATCSVCLGLPLLPAANQIFPDLLAGVIALGGLVVFLGPDSKKTPASVWLTLCALLFLPWLQIKFAATALLLVGALALKIHGATRERSATAAIALGTVFSFATLGAYNAYAFGQPFGPYLRKAMELSTTSCMVFFGLFFDQNQGFLLQNPVHLVGLFAVGALFVRDRRFFWLWLLVFMSLLAPNSMHTTWYGGWSLSGRFGWSATTVFFLPTVLGLVRLGEASPRALRATVAAVLALQAYHFYQYVLIGVRLYNRTSLSFLDGYTQLYYPIQAWLPALYARGWAYGFLPNYAWLVFLLTILGLGFLARGDSAARLNSRARWALAAGALCILVAGSAAQEANSTLSVTGAKPLFQSWQAEGAAQEGAPASAPDSAAEWTGVKIPLRKGVYQLVLQYASPAPPDRQIGMLEVWDASDGVRVAQQALRGSAGAAAVAAAPFAFGRWNPHRFAFKCVWSGAAGAQVQAVTLNRM